MANDFQKPSFFKIMLGDYKKKLRIPSHFASHISTETSKVAILEGPSGNCWEVKVQKIVNDIFFKKGWRMFLEDHTLQERDFLVFIHDGRMRFSVKIFGPNACEREDSFRVECSLEPTRSFPVSKNCQGCNFRQEQRAFTGVKAKDAANSFSSRLNFFVRGMKAYNVENRCQLNVPSWFAKALLPRVSTKVILTVDGRMWPVTHYVNNNVRMFTTGFAPFVYANKIQVGDYCAFELVDSLTMAVHIFRGDGELE